MPGIASKDDLTPEQQACLKKVTDRFEAANRWHSQLEPRWNTWYGLSRNWRRGAAAFQQANTPNDKDIVLDELKRSFGQELFIPYCYTTIETNVPRIVSKTPRYRARPEGLAGTSQQAQAQLEAAEQARAPMERLYERDAEAMRYERKLQETVRSGLRYGLGVQKSYWEKKTRDGKKITKRMWGLGRKAEDSTVVVFEGPQTESVDIFDFFWDPAGHDLESCEYVIHRTWRTMAYVKEQVEEGRRNRANNLDKGWAELDLDAISKLATSKGRSEAWKGRYEAAGLSDADLSAAGGLFEVWEYHDRDSVVTVLGGKDGILVQEDLNPFLHGEFPFEIYRPTLVEHEFCGVGEVEPIAHLQWELNTLRGQRRDAATLALNRGYFYQRGTLNPKEIVIGAGVFNPVLGNPSEIVQPMPFTDIPQSGDSEEAAIKNDIEFATAISESVAGSGGEETATGTQLVQQAANLRIKQKGKNLHIDLIVPECKKREALYEQHVVAQEQTQTIAVEDPRQPTGYSHLQVTPEMYQLVEMCPIDGSTEADDPIQKKHDAMELAQALAPFAEAVNVPELVKYIVGQHDVENVAAWIKSAPQGPDVGNWVQQIGMAMQQAGIPEEQITEILESAHQASEAAQPREGEGGQSTAPTEQPAPAEGSGPEPNGAQQ